MTDDADRGGLYDHLPSDDDKAAAQASTNKGCLIAIAVTLAVVGGCSALSTMGDDGAPTATDRLLDCLEQYPLHQRRAVREICERAANEMHMRENG